MNNLVFIVLAALFAAAARDWSRIRAVGEPRGDADSDAEPLVRRPPARRRRSRAARGAAPVGGSPSRAGFARVAGVRAATLLGLVGEPSREALERSLRRLTEEADARAETPGSALRPSSSRTDDEALVARCVLETDPDLATRLEFLALEGALEAEAAAAWWRNRG